MGEAGRFRPTDTCPWPLLTQAYLDKDTPSRRAGMKKKMELKKQGLCLHLIRDTSAYVLTSGQCPGYIAGRTCEDTTREGSDTAAAAS